MVSSCLCDSFRSISLFVVWLSKGTPFSLFSRRQRLRRRRRDASVARSDSLPPVACRVQDASNRRIVPHSGGSRAFTGRSLLRALIRLPSPLTVSVLFSVIICCGCSLHWARLPITWTPVKISTGNPWCSVSDG